MATAQVIAVDDAGAEQPGLVLGPRRPVAADRRVLLEIDHDAEAIGTLKVAGPIAIFFLVGLWRRRGAAGRPARTQPVPVRRVRDRHDVLRADLVERFPPLLEGLDADYLRHGDRAVHQNRRAQPQPRAGIYRDHPVPIRHRRLRDVGAALAGHAEPGMPRAIRRGGAGGAVARPVHGLSMAGLRRRVGVVVVHGGVSRPLPWQAAGADGAVGGGGQVPRAPGRHDDP